MAEHRAFKIEDPIACILFFLEFAYKFSGCCRGIAEKQRQIHAD